MDRILQDLRYALRMLRKRPAFTLAAVASLALGLGANTAIFSVVDAVVLRPLPFPSPEQLVTVTTGSTRTDADSASYPDYKDWRDQARSFSHLAAYHGDNFILATGDEPERLSGTTSTANLFELLGVQPRLGRGFLPEEDQPGKNHVVVISDRLFRRRWDGNPAVLGQSITLDGQSYTVIGVAPPGFRFPLDDKEAELWVPLPHGTFELQNQAQRGAHYLKVVGRMKPGVSVAAAEAEMSTLQEALARLNEDDAGRVAGVRSLHEVLVAKVRPALLVLLGAVGFVLLIACANVANLLLARATVRQREIAVRTALGASRGQLVRQLLTESVVLGLLGAVAGILLATWGIDALVAWIPSDIPRIHEISLDARVLAFTLGAAVITSVLFGLIPALQASSPQPHQVLKEASPGAAMGRHRLRAALIVGEIALAVLLLVGAGLMLRSFWRVHQVDPGFDPEGLLVARIDLPSPRYAEDAAIIDFYRRLSDRLPAIPGAASGAVVAPLPFGGMQISLSYRVVGQPEPPPGQRQSANERSISPTYFRAMGIPFRQGRAFSPQDDDPKAPPVVIINDSMARKNWPGGDALGKRVIVGGVEREIVGVVADVRHAGLDLPSGDELYMPYTHASWPFFEVVLRSSEPMALVAPLRAEVRGLDPGQPIGKVRTMEEAIGDSLAGRRLSSLLLSVFSTLALLLASIGIYGVMSYAVSQRTREFGIRMALGAAAPDVLRLVVRQGARLVGLGVLIGVVAALLLTRVMAGLLYEVSSVDPMTYGAVAGVLAMAAFVALWGPARRATRADPVVSLRAE